MSGQFGLLRRRRFAPFFATQFLGAFNDNLFKNALVVLLTFQAAGWTGLPVEIVANLAAGIFILPFFLFSATAGQLADKYDKATLARLVKVLEMLIMGVAAAGFWIHDLVLLLAAVFLLGCHSTLFGPVKYAILPQHLHEDELVGGNALVEAGTFVAILAGTLAGGLLADTVSHPAWIAVGGLAVAAAGYLGSRAIPPAPPPDPGIRINPNPVTETWRNIGFAREDPKVFLAILGISWFWLYGALFLAQFPAYAKLVLGGDELAVTLLLATFTVGIGLGSLLCERLSREQLEIGLVPFGSLGLTLFGLDLAFASPASLPAAPPLGLAALLAQPYAWHVLVDLALIGIFGGFFIVPLYALMQLRSPVARRARIVAANNILNALFMVAGALAAAGLLGAGLSIAALFGMLAFCNAAVAVYIYGLVPEFLLRFMAWLLLQSFCRLEKRGLEHIPLDGPALLACSPASLSAILVLMAASRRPIRFVVDPRLARMPFINPLLRHAGAILMPPPGSLYDGSDKVIQTVAKALEAGELVAIFPEMPLSATAASLIRGRLPARILDQHPVPVIPVTLGPIGARTGHRAMVRQFLAPHIGLVAGPPLPSEPASPVGLETLASGLRSKAQ